jgi:hypothetical protein
MYRKLILAGAMTAALTAPAFAEWNVLKAVPGPSGSQSACLVVERIAAPAGETLIAGPFATEAEAKSALDAAPACENRNANESNTNSGAAPSTPN